MGAVNHAETKVKVHYNAWGSSYNEWYVNQADRCMRFAKFGSITTRKIKRKELKKLADSFYGINSDHFMQKIEVKLASWFWKKNEGHIPEVRANSIDMNEWRSAKVISYKQSAKYADHIKVGVYVNDDHYEWWVHPDNADEIRPITESNDY